MLHFVRVRATRVSKLQVRRCSRVVIGKRLREPLPTSSYLIFNDWNFYRLFS